MSSFIFNLIFSDRDNIYLFNTLDFFIASDRGVFVCTPEPTAIENAFRFIKAAYLRKLKKIIQLNSFQKIVKEAVRDDRHPAQQDLQFGLESPLALREKSQVRP